MRPMFWKAKSKDGFKTINYRPSPVLIVKKIERSVDFLIFKVHK